MSRIPQSFLDDLLSRLDIVDVVDSRVKLKRTGKNYAACCPFHQEKTPSFTVSPDKQFYYCFGCGANGNAIGFLMEHEHQSFVDAVESLAKTVGLEVPREQDEASARVEAKRRSLFQILEASELFYQNQLRQNPKREQAIRYLKDRGLDGVIAKRYGLGYAPPGYDNLLKAHGTGGESLQQLVDAGLVIDIPEENRRYDRFRHRVMFPIHDERGRVVGFGGRVLGDDKPKYLNSPETDVFHKSQTLYGLYHAKQQRQLDTLLVVEGYMDVIALAQYGLPNAVATLGTACGEDHLRLAFRSVNQVVFCFDGDNAGRTAAKRALMSALPAMEDGRQIRFLFLPEGQDPDSLVRQIGRERFLQQIECALPFEDFLFDVAAEGIDLGALDGRARFSKVAAPLIDKLPEGIFRELMLEQLARRTGLTREVLNELQTQALPPVSPAPAPTEIEASKPANEPNTGSHGEIEPPPTHAEKQQRNSAFRLPPAKIATILILEDPTRLQEVSPLPELGGGDDPDEQTLCAIIDYLNKRPSASFNSLLGYWGGARGAEAQQALATLVANQFLSEAKTLATYQPLEELRGALNRIASQHQRARKRAELATLRAKGLSQLSAEERKRLVQLTRP